MEKDNIAIIEEIRATIARLREELGTLEDRLSELDFEEPEQAEEIVVEDVAAGETVEEEIVAEEIVAEESPLDITLDDDMPQMEDLQDFVMESENRPEPETQSDFQPAPESVPERKFDLESVPEPEQEALEEKPVETVFEQAAEDAPKVFFESVMPDTLPWKRDVPGSAVQNILSAISLNDRVQFINALFGGDPLLFQDTVRSFNGFSSLAEAENFIAATFPKWKLDSDVVYRFMMAVRRKLN